MLEIKTLENIGATLIALAVTIIAIIYWKYAQIKDQINLEIKETDKNSKVLVILPISRQYNQTHQNQVWDSYLQQQCTGSIRYCFVCESISDPAYNHFLTYMESRGYKNVKENAIIHSNFNEKDEISIIITGKSYHNSQKVHNMFTGVMMNCQLVDQQNNQQSSQQITYYENNGWYFPFDYIAFFDDDLEITPHTLTNLILPLENDENVGVSTGYSVEVPTSPQLSQYATMVYRTINLLGFATKNVNYVWGGCFACRGAEFLQSKIPTIWLDGGYSDDMVIGNYVKQHGKTIYAAPQNMFRNRPAQNTSFKSHYFNYVKRQYFTLTTYFCAKDRIISYIALIQLLIGGLITIGISGLVIADLAYQLWNKNVVQALRIVAVALLALFTIGKSIIRGLNSLESQIDRCNGKSENPTQLNALLAGFALIINFVCTFFMVIQVSLSDSIQWGPSTYTFQKGRVYSVSRPDDKISANENVKELDDQMVKTNSSDNLQMKGSIDKAQSIYITLINNPAYAILNFE